LAQISQRLDEAEKQKRQFRDDMERSQEALLIMVRFQLQVYFLSFPSSNRGNDYLDTHSENKVMQRINLRIL